MAAIARRFFERSLNSHKLLMWQGDTHEELMHAANSASSMARIIDATDASDGNASDKSLRVRRRGMDFDQVFDDASPK